MNKFSSWNMQQIYMDSFHDVELILNFSFQSVVERLWKCHREGRLCKLFLSFKHTRNLWQKPGAVSHSPAHIWELRSAASAHDGEDSSQSFIDHCHSSWWEHQDSCYVFIHVQNVLDVFVGCISIFLQVSGVKDWISLSLKWKDLERQWRCRVEFQGLIWQPTIFTGYDRDQGALWSGSG